MNEIVVDGERVNFIRTRANKVLDFLLDECTTLMDDMNESIELASLEDQKAILELALADVNGRL